MVDRAIGQGGRIDRGEGILDACGHLGLGEIQVPRSEGNVLLHSRPKELIRRILEDHSYAAIQLRRLQAADVRRCQSHAALLRAKRRMRTFSKVVLPEPLAPITATNSPSSARKEGSARASIPSG